MIDTAGDIDLSIIEKHAWVIVVMCQTLHCPFALGVGSREQPCAAVVTINQDIELTVMIFHRASPHTLRVEVLTFAQVIPVVIEQFLQWVSTIFPVHHILRLQDGSAREMNHRGRYHIIGVAHTNHIGIGNICPHHRVGISAVAIVSNGDITQVVGYGIIHLDIVGIPLPAGATTSLCITIESGNGMLRVLHQFIQVDIIVGMRQRHGHIATIIEQILETQAPLRG